MLQLRRGRFRSSKGNKPETSDSSSLDPSIKFSDELFIGKNATIVRNFLIFLPSSVVIICFLLMWIWPDWLFHVYLLMGIVSSLLASFIAVVGCLKFNQIRSASIFETIISLLSLRQLSGFSLILVTYLGFTWLIDFLREIVDRETVRGESIAGVFYSIAILGLTATIVIFIDKQKAARKIMSASKEVDRTKGLIISLGLLAKNNAFYKFEKMIDDIDVSREQFKEYFQLLVRQKREALAKKGEDLQPSLDKANSDNDFLGDYIRESSLFPVLAAVMHHIDELEHIWILTSKEASKNSYPLFLKIIKKFVISKNVKVHEERVEDSFNVDEISNVVNRIYLTCAQKNLNEFDITTDITSGTAVMSAGCVLAVVRSKRKAQYLRQSDFQLQKIDVTISALRYLAEEIVSYFETEIMTEKDR